MSAASRSDYDIGEILSEMREAYWAGISEQEEAAGEQLECLLFTLGGESFAFETHHASEVLRIPRLVRVPSVQEIVMGIFNLRGEITAAMDVRPLLGLPQPPLGAAGRLVVVKAAGFSTGILVEAAHGVLGLPYDQYEAAPGGNQAARFIRGGFESEGGRVVLLDLPALLASPEIRIGE